MTLGVIAASCDPALHISSNIYVDMFSNIPVYNDKQEQISLKTIICSSSNIDVFVGSINYSSNYLIPKTIYLTDQLGNYIYTNKLDANGNIIYDYEYDMKYIKVDGTIVDKIYYEANKDHTYRMAFVGCAYKCS